MRNPINTAVMVVGLCGVAIGIAMSAERSTTEGVAHTLLRSGAAISTHPSKEACFAARTARRELDAPLKTIGQTRYVCREDDAVTVTYGPNPVTPPSPVREAALSWTTSTLNTDGSPAVIAGYRIHYGRTPAELTFTVDVMNPAASAYVIRNLDPGTWYFGARAIRSDGVQSAALSNVVSKVIL